MAAVVTRARLLSPVCITRSCKEENDLDVRGKDVHTQSPCNFKHNHGKVCFIELTLWITLRLTLQLVRMRRGWLLSNVGNERIMNHNSSSKTFKICLCWISHVSKALTRENTQNVNRISNESCSSKKMCQEMTADKYSGTGGTICNFLSFCKNWSWNMIWYHKRNNSTLTKHKQPWVFVVIKNKWRAGENNIQDVFNNTYTKTTLRNTYKCYMYTLKSMQWT